MPPGESQDKAARPIDALPRADALSAMLTSHAAAVAAVAPARPAIDAAAGHLAEALARGRAVFYVAAGSSGLMALADACELPGTFGVDPRQIRICMAGGVPADGIMPGATEDDDGEATAAVRGMAPGDVAIVVSASGTTPFAVAFAEAAVAQGNTVIGIANVSAARLLELADLAIAIPTPAEVIEGSTRLSAGTAQKVALNMMSTQAGILMGHVHDGMMVNLVADNIKLRKRAARIVARIAAVPEEAAVRALEVSRYDAKLAVLIALGVGEGDARNRLAGAGGRLRDCLATAPGDPSTN
ncbi:N-acetylmuramic acid 6-phosphate etherase [Defluviimonas sp. WL0024]|uniref:N-acetylmuramic acid 6-phosphate etherase n=2 Tax=Albidovulum TaxID=205889 RepID=A0ABT3J705_9RHOB|nr:N-acetylmuramic acid 6-phosphate etherase [Defluviimonas sp. WL0024]MCU9850071.1 N-acetylmuramic acid 6-phosphate etherase [Defluviimonas sp. WL0024]MCW3783454.1 N-acetylmuramic acid 6-phosphate etherase [Defluviimonas salinarum]